MGMRRSLRALGVKRLEPAMRLAAAPQGLAGPTRSTATPPEAGSHSLAVGGAASRPHRGRASAVVRGKDSSSFRGFMVATARTFFHGAPAFDNSRPLHVILASEVRPNRLRGARRMK